MLFYRQIHPDGVKVGLSGIFPASDAFLHYCPGETDRLHLNARGHYRLAKTIQYQLLALPSSF